MEQKYLIDTNANNFALISHNFKDFQKITELNFIDSYHLESNFL